MANDYGIRFGNLFRKGEWKAIKKELQKLDAKNDNFELTKADYKEIKAHIKAGDLGAYMDKISDDMRNALGLSLKGKVDDLDEAQRIAKGVKLENADLDKVLKYISNAQETPKNNELAIQTMNTSLAGKDAVITSNERFNFYTQTKPFIDERFMEFLG